MPIAELAEGRTREAVEEEIHALFRTYRRSLQGDRRVLAESFRFVDLARKVVGVGSVGTRCWILLMLGRDDEDPLFLQVKEAQASVLEPILGKSKFRNHGQRVVEGQRLMQAASDIFLGWIRNPKGLDGISRDFYVRQLWDWKTSVDLETILPLGLQLYAQMCGWTLARAHARSGDRIAIAAYLGKSDAFDRALADFAVAYADLNERDYNVVVEAVRDGRITAEEGDIAVSPARDSPLRALREAAPAAPSADRFLNRELSWLDFDRRVLELAADPGVPLLERVKLCGIVSSNLDEFFAVRMAGTREQVESRVELRSPDGRTARQTLEDARQRVLALNADQDALWLDVLRPALAAEGIRIVSFDECTPRERRALTKRFDREIAPLLTPIAVGSAAPFPYVSSLALNIAAIVVDAATGERRFVRVNVPDGVPRFVGVGSRGTRVLVEDLIVHFLDDVVGGAVEALTVFRVTRDADFALSDDADDLLEAVELQLAQRRFGEVVRLEVGHDAAAGFLDVLTRELQITSDQVYRRRSPLGLDALLGLASVDRPELRGSARGGR